MDLADPAPGSGPSSTLVVITTAIATTVLLTLLGRIFWPSPPKLIPSPLHTVIPKLPKSEVDKLEYTPDAFPGKRDVETPYGSIRVYEWGPLTGRKVLLVHGISTTCMTLTKLAHALADTHNCRVMLFDLFGRGFSDNPSDLPHDARLYTTQILLALASSPLSWTGPSQNAFTLIGYSMGGGISAHFASSFPHLVRKLILLAPAGLIDPSSFGPTRHLFTTNILPPALLSRLVAAKLRNPIRPSSPPKSSSSLPIPPETQEDEEEPISALEAQDSDDEKTSLLPNHRTYLDRLVMRNIQWMVVHSRAFVPAFISSIRDAPLTNQHDVWRRLASRTPGSTLVILGRGDEVIDVARYTSEGLPLLGGPGRVRWVTMKGGHDFPMTYAGETMEVLGAFLDEL